MGVRSPARISSGRMSRQRQWGVPMTIFLNKKTGEMLRDQIGPQIPLETEEAAVARYKTQLY